MTKNGERKLFRDKKIKRDVHEREGGRQAGRESDQETLHLT